MYPFFIIYNDYDINGTTVAGCPSKPIGTVGDHNLGPWLEFYPGINTTPNPNLGNTFGKAEKIFMDQYDLVYQSYLSSSEIPRKTATDPDIPLNNLDDVSVTAMAWFKYSCVKGLSFDPSSNNDLVPCNNPYSNPLSDQKKTELENELIVEVFPNPTQTQEVMINFPIPSKEYEVILYNSVGEVLKRESIFSNSGSTPTSFVLPDHGVFLMHVIDKNQGASNVIKVISAR